MKLNNPDRFSAFLLLNRVPLVSSVILLGLLMFMATYVEVDRIESRIHEEVSEAVSIPAAKKIQYEVEGRDLLVYGDVFNMTAMNQLEQNVSLLEGIRSVKFDVDITPERVSYLKIVSEDANEVYLVGELSQQGEIEGILAMVSKVMPNARLIDNLSAKPNISDSLWYEILEPTLKQVAKLQSFTLEFGLGRVVLSGFMENQSRYAKMVRNLERLTSENDLKFVNRVGSVALANQ